MHEKFGYFGAVSLSGVGWRGTDDAGRLDHFGAALLLGMGVLWRRSGQDKSWTLNTEIMNSKS